MLTCVYCDQPSIAHLDGDDLCERHANEWVHGEGRAAAEHERSGLGTPASMMNGNAMQRYKKPDAWARWEALCESWGQF